MSNVLCYCPAYTTPHSPERNDCEARLFLMALADTGIYVDTPTAVSYVETELTWESAVKVFLDDNPERGYEERVRY